MFSPVFLIIISFPLILSRGPHHPRGDSIAHQHIHYRPTRKMENGDLPPIKLTQDAELLHDTEHLKDDLGDVISEEDIDKMTEEELEFHYFKLHDFDNNTKLDGLEILQAIHHTSLHGENSDDEILPNQDFDFYIELIDRVLSEDDLDGDGYLSYPEYVLGRIKDSDNRKYATSPKTIV